MKKQRTAKHRKQHKKEIANRKAKRSGLEAQHDMLFGKSPISLVGESTAKPASPARRAFQDI